jgi:hypothetical protein
MTEQEVNEMLKADYGIQSVSVEPWGVTIYVESIERYYNEYTTRNESLYKTNEVRLFPGLRVVEIKHKEKEVEL